MAENKQLMNLAKKSGVKPEELAAEGIPTGEASLRKAIQLKPEDFDALSSLGGVLKRQNRLTEAYECYERAAELSQGSSYPLLNALTIQCHMRGALDVEAHHKLMLNRSARLLTERMKADIDMPWTAFDLAQTHLFLCDDANFLTLLEEGILASTHKWQPQTFRATLELLVDAGVELPGLKDGIELLKQADRLPD
jgi:tetratricopeptide (TPR) repeat protein